MNERSGNSADEQFTVNAMTAFLQIGAVLLLVGWCFSIVSPFIGIVAWSLIIAVALYPLHLTIGGSARGSTEVVLGSAGIDRSVYLDHTDLDPCGILGYSGAIARAKCAGR